MLPIARIAPVVRTATCIATEVAAVVTRLLMLHVFTPDGLGKWRNHDAVTAFFRDDLHIPAASAQAWFIAALELVGGIAIALGLGTRLFAVLLTGTMVVALLTADGPAFVAQLPWGTEHDNLMSVAPVPLLMGLLWLIGRGGGVLGIDRLIWRAWRRRFPESATR